MKVEYYRQGAARKELVQAISDITCTKAKYLFLPTRAYQIGSILVGETGTVECEDVALLRRVAQELAVKGFQPENDVSIPEAVTAEQTSPEEITQETAEPEAVTEPEPMEEHAETEKAAADPAGDPEPEKVDHLTISLPDDFTEEEFGRLQNLVASKAGLIKKALGTDDLTITRENGKISFPWFHEANSAKFVAYSKLLTALCQFAKKAKRVSTKEHEVPNEKYAFRCFLLRLGFIGTEYKECRKILLEKLSGSAAFRNGGGKDAVSQ